MSSSTKLGLPKAKENTYLLFNLLSSGKKVVMKDRPLRYIENIVPDNPFEESTKRTKVIYVYANGQFNRILAKLEDGRTVDFEINFLDMCWNSFEEWKSPEMHLEDKVLGIIQSKKEQVQKIHQAGAYAYATQPHPQSFTVEELQLIAKLLGRENQ